MGATRKITGQQFLDQIGETDGAELGYGLLEEAVEQRSSDDVEYAVVLLFEFGVRPDELELLKALSDADWHRSYNDVVTLLEKFPPEQAVPILVEIARRPPEKLDEIDAQTLSNNATWAIYRFGGDAAEQALESLGSGMTAESAQLSRRLLERLRSEADTGN